jgi:predicted metalloprotease with PDZ domain
LPASSVPVAPTHYRIVPLDAHAHLYEVSVTVAGPEPSGQCFWLPTWIPGSYLIREFARHFVAVRAECAGAVIAISKDAKNVWRAAPCTGALTVTAQVYAFDLSVRTAYLDAMRGYFNGAAVFLCPLGREGAPCIVDIVAPTGATWRVATTLPRDGAAPYSFGRYRASNYDELIDHPVETGNFTLATFGAGGATHDIAISGRHHADMPRLAHDLERICQWQIDLFGGGPGSCAPVDRYLFQVMAVGDGHGGLEHRASTSLLCRRDSLPRIGDAASSDDYVGFLGLASHEYFHTWNIKRIKPSAFVPYDLASENYTRQLWAFEGITSYYDDLALVRCGLIAPPCYLELLGRAMTTVSRGPGRLTQSVAESSFDAWIKFYRQDENAPNAIVSYYAKGSLVALALDLILRLGGRASLDDVMRALWVRHGQTGHGVPEDGIPALVSELAGRDLSDFFARHVFGTEDPPLTECLAEFGVTLKARAAAGTKDRGGLPAAEKLPRCTLGARCGDDLRIIHVLRSGPASRAGLSAGDAIVAIDGLKVSTAGLAAILQRANAGDVVHIHAFRRDELMSFAVTLDAAPADTTYLALDPAATPSQVTRRTAWLGSAQ